MSDPVVKLKKLRTFYDDISQLQNSSFTETRNSGNEIDPLLTPRVTGTKAAAALPKNDLPPSEAVKPAVKLNDLPPVSQTLVPKPADLPEATPTPVASPIKAPVTTPQPQTSGIDPKLVAKIDTTKLEQQPKASLLSGHGAIFSTIEDGSEKSEGHIITDQKRERFKLLPAIGMALKDWFGKKQRKVEKLLETKEDSPIVADASTRQTILKDAAQKSAIAPKDDYTKVAKRIKKVSRRNLTPTTLVIKKPSEEQAPSWTHVVDEASGEELESTATTKNESLAASILPKETGIRATTSETTKVNEPEVTAQPQIPISAPVVEPALPQLEITKEPEPTVETTEPDLIEDPTWFESSAREQVMINPDLGESVPVRNQNFTETTSAVRQFKATPNVTSFSWWRLSAIATLAILLGISFTLWLFGGDDKNVVVVNEQNQFTPLINAQEEIPVALGSNGLSTMQNLQSVTSRPTSVLAIIYPTVNIAGSEQPASAADILNTLDWKAPGSFIRNVSDINFGLYRNTDPFIIMKISTFDTAFGGILAWERTMSTDLSPLFGAPVNGTFDPTSRSATQIREPYFVDTVINNIDARSLTDERQKERLIYAFSDRNTIIITTNKTALGDLLNLLR